MPKLRTLSECQNHRCCYCGFTMVLHVHTDGQPPPQNAATRDHIIPKCHGGPKNKNLVAACVQCNNLRGDMDPVAFYNLLSKLFRRSATLQERWHDLSSDELKSLRLRCIDTHERQLAGLARRSIEHAFRHQRLLLVAGHNLTTAP